MACFLLSTFLSLRPLFSVPRFLRRIARATSCCAFLLYLGTNNSIPLIHLYRRRLKRRTRIMMRMTIPGRPETETIPPRANSHTTSKTAAMLCNDAGRILMVQSTTSNSNASQIVTDLPRTVNSTFRKETPGTVIYPKIQNRTKSKSTNVAIPIKFNKYQQLCLPQPGLQDMKRGQKRSPHEALSR